MKRFKSASLVVALLLGIALSGAYASSALAAGDLSGEYHVIATDDDGSTDETVMNFSLTGTTISMESEGVKLSGTYDPASGKASLEGPFPDQPALTFIMDLQFVEADNSFSFSGTMAMKMEGEAEKSIKLEGGRIEG